MNACSKLMETMETAGHETAYKYLKTCSLQYTYRGYIFCKKYTALATQSKKKNTRHANNVEVCPGR